jgi:hypothetical protein
MPRDRQSAHAGSSTPFRRMTVLRYGECVTSTVTKPSGSNCGCALDLGALQAGPVTEPGEVLVERPWSGCCVDRSQKVVLIAEPERAATSTCSHSDWLAVTSWRCAMRTVDTDGQHLLAREGEPVRTNNSGDDAGCVIGNVWVIRGGDSRSC